MPNLDAASALIDTLPSAPVDSTAEGGEAGAPPAAEPVSAVESTVAPKVTASEERIARSKAAIDAKEVARQRAALESERENFSKEQGSWKSSLRSSNPLDVLKAGGMDALEAYQAIHKEALEKDSPEYKTRQAIEEAKAEAKAAREENAAIKAHLDAQAKAAVEREFLSAVTKQDFSVDYDDDELIKHGHRIADVLAGEKKPFTLEDIVTRLQEEHQERAKKIAARRAQRTPATPKSPPAAQAGAAKTTKPADTEPSAIGNHLVSETATAGTARMSREERLARAGEMISASLKQR